MCRLRLDRFDGCDAYWERIPSPVVKVVSLSRATTADGISCSDAGSLQLSVSLPASSTYKINDFGVYFRVISGKLSDEVFPNIPLVGAVRGNEMTITLHWLDGAPSQQAPLDMSVEVFLISNSMNIGTSSTFVVKSGYLSRRSGGILRFRGRRRCSRWRLTLHSTRSPGSGWLSPNDSGRRRVNSGFGSHKKVFS